MIRSTEIKNLRGIQEGRLDNLTPLVVLVGPNGSGKSTVLDALLIGASPIPGDAIGQTVRRRAGVKWGARWLLWRGGIGNQATVKTVTGQNATRHCSLSLSLTNPPDSPAIELEVTDQFKNETNSGRTGTRFSAGNNYEYSPCTMELQGVPNVGVVEFDAKNIRTPLHTLMTKAIEQGRGKEARELLAAVVSGLIDVRILTEDDSPLVYLEYADHAVPIALAGDGVYALARLCYELASRPGGVVLLEEPEVHQHPGAIHQSAKAVLAAMRRNIQVIISTHSMELIDSLLAEVKDDAELAKLSVYGLRLDDGRLQHSRFSGQEVAVSRVQIGNDLR